eukprot:Amastigsp_a679646_172.p4 type:complete len:103 gc:universal Amastigsp_a679646_172:290-598(+)
MNAIAARDAARPKGTSCVNRTSGSTRPRTLSMAMSSDASANASETRVAPLSSALRGSTIVDSELTTISTAPRRVPIGSPASTKASTVPLIAHASRAPASVRT